ncbi:MAG: G8 domain-containing protein [Armatimonadota bacterium]|nr:G8 domain-containing protein [Armatimonadota bacterium]
MIAPLHAQSLATIASAQSGNWSDPATWAGRRTPARGDAVLIAPGHTVVYDVYSDTEIRRLQIQGSLAFARYRSTRLDVGNVIVDRGGTLEMGAPDDPIPAGVTAEVRFVTSPLATCTGGMGFVESDIGLWVMSGGRWEAHGAPVRTTWTKLATPALAGTSLVRVVDNVTDWEPGSWVVLTPTDLGRRTVQQAQAYPQYEEFQVVRATARSGVTELQLSGTLRYTHDATGDTVGEVALLSRNVVVTAKYPNDRMNGHTLYMQGAGGGLSYVEFRELGNLGCLGRYPVHFHLMADTSRGTRVRGVSIWRSDNNFMNIHGSNGVTVENSVGYNATGVGYFIGEPATGMVSVDSLFVDNLAARVVYRDGALHGKYRAAGFWIESLNSSLVGNVASGSWGRGTEDSGFHIAEGPEYTQGFNALLMVRNESHSNNGSGLHTWNNSGPPLAVVDFRAWRNGFAGIKWGAYRNRMQVHRASLFENGAYNLQTSAIQIFLADSQLFGTAAYPTPVGAFVAGYHIANSPDRPSLFFRNTFAGHRVHVSQDHSRCASTADELDPASRRCSAAYLMFRDNRFSGGTAFDFGWHRNAHSFFNVANWNGTASPSISALNFRLTRRDRPRPSAAAYYYAPFDAWLDPSASVSGAGLPLATLTGLTDGAPMGTSVTFQVTATAAAGIERVTYYVDEQPVATQTSGPFRHTWSTAGWARRYAHVYAAVTDTHGQTGYTQVIRLRR